eukprot:Gb_37700 [translate_table: standard]
MVPNDYSTFDFKVSSKGLSWVDLMYQKFEAICVEVDKNPSLLIQETTKYVENQMSAVGVNVQKFCTEFIEDILPPTPEVDIKCVPSNTPAKLGEDFELFEKSKQELGNIQTPNSESLVSPLAYQEETFDLPTSNAMKQLAIPSVQEEAASANSIQNDGAENNHMGHHCEDDVCEDISVDVQSLQETTGVGKIAGHSINQKNAPLQLDSILLADRTGVEGLADEGQNGNTRLAGRIQLNSGSSTEDVSFKKIGKLEVNLGEVENGKQKESGGDGERVLSVVEPFITSPPSCSKEEQFHEPLVLTEIEKEQSAYWYENKYVDRQYRIDTSSSNSFVDVLYVDKYTGGENCDSDWELL